MLLPADVHHRNADEVKSCFIQNYTGNHQNQNSQISSNIGILEKHSSYHRNISQNRYFFNSELILKRNLLHIAVTLATKIANAGANILIAVPLIL